MHASRQDVFSKEEELLERQNSEVARARHRHVVITFVDYFESTLQSTLLSLHQGRECVKLGPCQVLKSWDHGITSAFSFLAKDVNWLWIFVQE